MHTCTTTVLLVGHGSRRVAANDALQQFAAIFQTYLLAYRVRLCFIECAAVLLNEGLDQAARESIDVIIVPLMLGAAGHVTVEIPQHVKAAKQRHRDVTFIIAKHLGADTGVLQALLLQMQKNLPHAIKFEVTSVVLLGRGSSNMMANGELAKMARWIFESGDCSMVDVAFSGLTTPPLETVVQRHIHCGMQYIIVLPYYLFAGVLIERIALQVQQLRRGFPAIFFSLAAPIGLSDSMYTLVHRRVLECIAKEAA